MFKRITAMAISLVMMFSCFTPTVYAVDNTDVTDDTVIVEENPDDNVEDYIGDEILITDEESLDSEETTDSENSDDLDVGDTVVSDKENTDTSENENTEDSADENTDESEKDTDNAPVLAETEAEDKYSVSALPQTNLPDSDELFGAYVEQQLYGNEVSFLEEAAREQLNDAEKEIYDYLKAEIKDVAANGGSTDFLVADITDWNIQSYFTAEELGVTSINNYDMVYAAFQSQFDFDLIIDALMHDCPYDMYWFNKTESSLYGYSVSSLYYSNAPTVYVAAQVKNLCFELYVVENYQESGKNNAVTSKVAAVGTAASNAKSIADKYDSASDYEKLKAFKDEICSLVTYDHNAAENGSFAADDDPWQLINVFDNDTATDVVCEGYSKAFQYLCDLSSFDGAECYTVVGTMDGGTGAGGHMWNIVTIDGKNYIADITNVDSGTIGENGELFLAGAEGSTDTGYIVDVSGSDVSYVYSSDTLKLWGKDILTIAQESYVSIADTIIDSGSCGDSASWTLYTDGSLVIDGEGNTFLYSEKNPSPWYKYASQITSVAFKEGMQWVNSGFLEGLEYVTKISFSHTMQHVGHMNFAACPRLEKIEVDERNQYLFIYDDMLVHNGYRVNACPVTKKGRVILPNGTTAVDEDVFANCSQITELVLPDKEITWFCDLSDLTALETIYVKGDGKAWENSEFNNGLNLKEDVEIVYNYVDNTIMYAGKCGDNASYSIDVMGNLVISGSGAMDNYQRGEAPWHRYYREIDNIIISEGITHIGNRAFSGFWSTENLQFASTIETIGEFAFSEMRELKSLTIPGNIKHIGENAFSGCHMETLTIEDGVETIGSLAFSANTHLEKIYIPDSVKSIGASAFVNCYKLKDVRLPVGITEIPEKMFLENDALESIVIPEGVTSINTRAFMNCESLKNVTLPSTLTTIGEEAFYYDESIETLDIPSSVQTINRLAFYGCKGLKTITIPSSVTEIGNLAFNGCTAVETIVYNDTADRWFSEFHEIVNVPNSTKYIFTDGDISYKEIKTEDGTVVSYSLVYWRGAEGDIVIPAEHNGLPVTDIERYAFSYNENITSVTIPETITEIKGARFRGCTALEKLTVSDTLINVQYYAFDGCEKLKNLYIDGDAQKFANRYESFKSSLYMIEHVYSSDDKPVFIRARNKYGNILDEYSLWIWGNVSGDIVIPAEYNGMPVTDIDPNAFAYDTSITSLVIPHTITKIKTGTFAGCTELTSLTVSERILDIEVGAFEDCDKLETLYFDGDAQNVAEKYDNIIDALPMVKNFYFTGEKIAFRREYDSDGNMLDEYYLWCWDDASGDIVIPDTYNGMPVVGIGRYVFMGKQDITSVDMSSNIEYVERSAFRDCTNLKSVTFSDKLYYIGDYTFKGCTSLEKVYCPSSYNWENYIAYIGVDNEPLTNAEFIFATDWGYLRYKNDIGEEVLSVQGKNNIGETLIIPSKILGIKVADIGAYKGDYFKRNETIKNVVISEGIKGFNLCIFNGCINIETIVLPGSIKYYYTDNYYYFIGVSEDAKIYAPEGSFARRLMESLDIFGPVQEYKHIPLKSLKAANVSLCIGTMTEVPKITLVPSNASFGVSLQWKVSGEYSDIIELVEGYDKKLRIRAKAIGDAVITVTDIYSGISTQIAVKVKLPDGEKLTAEWDTAIDEIGLEPGESRQMQITSPTLGAVSADMLNFASSSPEAVSVDENGVITANYTGSGTKSVTITATLKADKTKNVKLTVKAVAKQAKFIRVYAEADESIPQEYRDKIEVIYLEEDNTPVVIIPKELVADGNILLDLCAVSVDENGEEHAVDVTWQSDASAVATVAADKAAKGQPASGVYGLSTVTVKKNANANGLAVITATAKDVKKTAATVEIDVRDYTPRLETNTVTLNTNKLAGQEVALYTAYDAILKDYSEQAAMLLSEGAQVINVKLDGHDDIYATFDAENSTVTFNAADVVKNGTYKLTLNILTSKGITSQPITVKVANKLPKVTIKQAQPFELFLKDSTTDIVITATDPVNAKAEAVIKAVTMTDSDTFEATAYNAETDSITVSYIDKANPLSRFANGKTADTKVNLVVEFEGYREMHIQKNFTVKAKETKVTLGQSRSSTKYTVLSNDNTPISVINSKTKEVIDLTDCTVTLQDVSEGYVTVAKDGTELTITPQLNGEGKFSVNNGTSHSTKIDVQHKNWLRPITISHSISINTAVPTVKLKATSLKLNSAFDTTAETLLMPSLDNCPQFLWTVTEQPAKTQTAEDFAKLNVTVDGWKVKAEFKDGVPAKGAYKYLITTLIAGKEVKLTLTVNVAETLPSVTLAKTSAKLNSTITEDAAVKFKVPAGYEVTGATVTNSAGNLLTAEDISVEYRDGGISVKVLKSDLAKGNYKYDIVPVVKLAGEEYGTQTPLKKVLVLTVTVFSGTPTVTYSAKGKIDLVNRGTGIVYTLTKGTNFVYSAADVDTATFKLVGTDAEKFNIRYLGTDAKGQHMAEVTAKEEAQLKKGGKYSYNIAVDVNGIEEAVTMAKAVTVSPSQSTVKFVTKGSTTIYQSYKGTAYFNIEATTPVGAKIANVVILDTKATTVPNNALDFEVSHNADGSWKVNYTIKKASKLKVNKTYKVALEVTPQGNGENVKPQVLNVNLKVKR